MKPRLKRRSNLLDEATAAIQYNRDLLQTALDQVRQGISVFDRDMRLICWNRQFRELLGLPADYGQVGVSLYDIIRYCAQKGFYGPGHEDNLVRDRMEKLVVHQVTFHERMHHANIVLEIRTNPMPDGGIVTTYTDITERVEAAEALSRANETLEKRVRERTDELLQLNKELALAKKRADQANMDKTRFLAAAGHDILQPLNAARLYTTTLVENSTTEEQKRLTGNVEMALSSVEDILGAVLEISRLDAGAMKPHKGPVHLNTIFEKLKVEFAPLAEQKNLRLIIVPTSAIVYSDPRLLKRLLQNLVSNALKYTQAGKVLVGVRGAGEELKVHVCDTGVGIGEKEQELIFQEFQRLDSGAKVASGLGLGLSIVERLSRVLHHTIEVRSQENRGSCFTLTLLRSSRPLNNLPQQMSVPVIPQSTFKGVRILCIDNEPDILEGMVTLLNKWGCKVLPAEHRQAVINEIQSHGLPDLILADYHLDDDTGLEVIKYVREHFQTDCPAALITAERSAELRQEAHDHAIGFLNKPLKPAALRAFITRMTQKRQT
jgi:signal transduction histidine kinase